MLHVRTAHLNGTLERYCRLPQPVEWTWPPALQLLSGLHLMAFSSRLSFELSRGAQAFESHFRYAGASRCLRERRLRRPSARVKSSKRLEKQIRKLDGNKTAREFPVGIGLLTVFVYWINGTRPYCTAPTNGQYCVMRAPGSHPRAHSNYVTQPCSQGAPQTRRGGARSSRRTSSPS
jgi:hypothetical protein